ncbi:MAG: DUF4124 domain-containing protein [Pseudomonadota bacterium]
MRYLILLTLTACSAVSAAEMWRWVDSDGVTHYSDRAVPGATKFSLQSTATPSAPAATPSLPTRPATTRQTDFRYTTCAITNPGNDQVFTSVNTVNAALDLAPAQRPGDRVVMNLNGRRVEGWPEAAQSYVLTDMYRGSYTLSAQVLDETGKTICSSATVSFHIRQPSMLTPGTSVPKAPRAQGVPTAPKPAARP